VILLVGRDDGVTPPSLSEDYAAALRQRGIAAETVVLDGLSHLDVLRSPELMDAALRLGPAIGHSPEPIWGGPQPLFDSME